MSISTTTPTGAPAHQAPAAPSIPSTTRHSPRFSEDILAVIIGLAVVALSLPLIGGVDLLGWVVSTSVWTAPEKALGTVSKTFGSLGGPLALALTGLALLAVLSLGATALGLNARRFALRFAVVFILAYGSWS